MSSRFIARDVACGSATGRVYDYGAHVAAWAPRSERPVIWMPEKPVMREDVAIRGGIPICFPWFGKGAEGNREPKHGLARLSRWLLVDSFLDETEHTHQLTYRLTPKRMGTDDSFETQFKVCFGEELSLALTVTNTGAEDYRYEAALHTYLAVGDVTRVEVLGLDESSYTDWTVAPPEKKRQSLAITFDGGTVDRVFDSSGPVTVEDPNNARRIVVRKEGSANTVVWNPGVEGARDMADMGDEEWQRFVCVEAANCGTNAVTLAPGESHTLSQTLSVEHL